MRNHLLAILRDRVFPCQLYTSPDSHFQCKIFTWRTHCESLAINTIKNKGAVIDDNVGGNRMATLNARKRRCRKSKMIFYLVAIAEKSSASSFDEEQIDVELIAWVCVMLHSEKRSRCCAHLRPRVV